MSEFTKGPWIVLYDLNNRPVAIEAPHDMTIPGAVGHIVRTNGIGLPSSPVALANARLIAAAPDMYEALKRIKDNIGWRSAQGEDKDQYYCEFCGAHHLDFNLIEHAIDCAVTEVRAAIAKAEGR